MKILVTGGAGFIGKYLVKDLIKKDHQVTIFDNFSNSKKENILDLIKMNVKVIEGDITNYQEISIASKDQDLIIHLAAIISVEKSIKNPSETFKINVEGTRNVLESCKKNNIKKIIAASSAAVYGEGFSKYKLSEKMSLKPISPYGESKMKMEQEIIKFNSEYEINYIILRFFNIFGIGQTPEYAGVITKFVERIKENKKLEIFGDGNQIRDFVSVYDVINAINNSLSYKKNGVYNIASGKGISINELAQKMIFFSGKELECEHLNSKKGEIIFSQADISLAKKEIQFSPKFGLKDIKKLM